MKKSKVILICMSVILSLMLTTGCSSSNEPSDNKGTNVDDVNDNSLSEDLSDTGEEIKDDIKDTTDKIQDDLSDSAADNNSDNK